MDVDPAGKQTPKKKVGRPRTKTSSEKKRKKKEGRQKYKRTTIALSSAYDAWNQLRKRSKWTHGELALHLLDIHSRFCKQPNCKVPVSEEDTAVTEAGVTGTDEEQRSQARPSETRSGAKSASVAQSARQPSSYGSPAPSQMSDKKESRVRQVLFSTPTSEDIERSFPSDISALEDSSDSDSDNDIQPVKDTDVENGLEQSFVDEEVINFVPKFKDGMEPGEKYGRMTPDVSAKEATTSEHCIATIFVLEELVRNVVGLRCPTQGCDGSLDFRTTKRGSCAVIVWECHTCNKRSAAGSWASQPRVGGMYAGNLVFNAALLLSGNNVKKIGLMCQFANLWCPSSSNFYNLQKLYFSPVIISYWEEARRELLRGIGSRVVLAGDGRMDSPGHSAQFCTYSLMDHERKCVLTLQCIDVRQAKHSYDMERVGFTKAMEDLMQLGVNIAEVVTDAHTQIKSIMRTNDVFSRMVHQIDIWHASKSLLKRLSAAGKKKKCEVLLLWMASVRNHFWYASRTCEGETTKLKETWSKVALHVVNKHTWLDVEGYTDGGCSHGPLPEEHSKPWIQPNSEAHYELLGIIFDKKFMKDMPYYRNFRHTSYLESFHNHILMYASKRFSFGYDGYRTRNCLAAIDFNHHRNRADMKDEDGNIKLQAKYSKASKEWHPVPVKEPKNYSYIPDLMERIISARVSNPLHLSSKVPVREDHPRSIRPHVTLVPKPSMEELKDRYQSRFTGVPE